MQWQKNKGEFALILVSLKKSNLLLFLFVDSNNFYFKN